MTQAEEREVIRMTMDVYADVKALGKARDQLRADLEEARELLAEMSTLLTTESQIGERVKTFLAKTQEAV